MNTIWLVAKRELRERVASRAFQVSTALTVILVAGLLLAPTFFGLDEAPAYTIGTVGETAPELAAIVAATAPDDRTTAEDVAYSDDAALRDAVIDGDADIGVAGPTTIITGPGADPELTTLVTAALTSLGVRDRAAAAGLDEAELADLFAVNVSVEELADEEADEEATAVAFVGTVLLFISIVTYGQWILIGVVEEKSNRVVEVILGAVRARYLLAGKVLGIGLLGLAQLLLIALIGITIVRTTDGFDLPTLGPNLVFTVLLWFVLGFTFYATGFAVAGSLVSRQEEAQNASFPLTIVMLVGYIVASTSLTGGDNIALQVLSIIPPFSPMTMPLRQAAGNAAPWEIILAVVLMLAATAVMLRIGGRVYSGGLLRTGGKVKVREALRSAEV